MQPRLHAPSHKVASLPCCGLHTLPPALEGKGMDHLELPSNVPLYVHPLDLGLYATLHTVSTHSMHAHTHTTNTSTHNHRNLNFQKVIK